MSLFTPSKIRILLVDDEPKNIHILGALLKEEGYEIEFTTSGIKALQRIENEKFDLVLLDIMMPEMDGFEVCSRLKSNPETKHIPIIFLTALQDKQNTEKGFKVGGNDYLIKPFNPGELKARVRTQLNLKLSNDKIKLYINKIETQNKQITDNIAYAKSIQNKILPSDELMHKMFPEHYIFDKPMELISGDFYWVKNVDDIKLFAVADCTGHGVSAAFISLICNQCLNRAVGEFNLKTPGAILDKTRELIIDELEEKHNDIQDGMDICLCSVKENTLEFAGAYNSLYILRSKKNTFEKLKADRQPVSYYYFEKPFNTQETILDKGDHIYLFTDGYTDQFGTSGKKYTTSRLLELLKKINTESFSTQKRLLANEFDQWKGDLDQIDDICLMCIKL